MYVNNKIDPLKSGYNHRDDDTGRLIVTTGAIVAEVSGVSNSGNSDCGNNNDNENNDYKSDNDDDNNDN